jgi:hypothetical protein
MTLTAVEFLRRFVQHILPRGFVRIRQFGYLASACRTMRLAFASDYSDGLRLVRQPRRPHRRGTVRDVARRWSSARSFPRVNWRSLLSASIPHEGGTERLSIGVRVNVVTHVATVVWRAIWAE